MEIRLGTADDAAAMREIYNREVLETTNTFDLEPRSLEQQQEWISEREGALGVVVAEIDRRVVGFASLSPYRPRAAYQWSVEVTVYVNERYQGRGVGRAAYTSLIECLRLQGFRSAFAVIALPNPASVGLYENLGFDPIGIHRTAGYKLGQWHDIGWWQLVLQDHGASPSPPRQICDILDTPEWHEAISKGLDYVRG